MSLIFTELTINLSAAQIEAFLKAEIQKQYPGMVATQITPKTRQDRDFRGKSCGTTFEGFDIKLEKPRLSE